MGKTADQVTLDTIREELQMLIGQFDASIPPSFTQAIAALLTAMDYEDPALMRSRLEEVLEALLDVTREAIQKRLGRPKLVRMICQKTMKILKGQPRESFDEVGKEIERLFDDTLKILTDLRDGPVRLLQEHGCEVESAASLERDIEELKEMKQGLFASWPRSDQELPPVDRDMIARSRAAIARGEGEDIKDLIQRLGGAFNS